MEMIGALVLATSLSPAVESVVAELDGAVDVALVASLSERSAQERCCGHLAVGVFESSGELDGTLRGFERLLVVFRPDIRPAGEEKAVEQVGTLEVGEHLAQ